MTGYEIFWIYGTCYLHVYNYPPHAVSAKTARSFSPSFLGTITLHHTHKMCPWSVIFYLLSISVLVIGYSAGLLEFGGIKSKSCLSLLVCGRHMSRYSHAQYRARNYRLSGQVKPGVGQANRSLRLSLSLSLGQAIT